MVAVNPGWRTRRGFAADLSVTCQYCYKEASPSVVAAFVQDPSFSAAVRKKVAQDANAALGVTPSVEKSQDQIEIPADLLLSAGTTQPFPEPTPGSGSPLVEAVSPMTETQALDLESSARQQQELALRIALSLQAAGLTAQAAAFDDYLKRHQQDVSTITPAVAVNAYSHLGGMFGFQVGPRLFAVEKVHNGKLAAPADVLDRQSFPTLLLFGVDKSDLFRISKDNSGHFTLWEAQLLLITANNWVPIDPSTESARLTEVDQVDQSIELRQRLDAIPDYKDAALARTVFRLKARATSLQYRASGAGALVELPEDVFHPVTPATADKPQSNPNDPAKPTDHKPAGAATTRTGGE
jgi:hypothetical protein